MWRLLEDLTVQLKRNGESLPFNVTEDLRSAKTMIETLRLDPSRSETLLRIEEHLRHVESYLIPAAEKRFGKEYVNDLMNRLNEAMLDDENLQRGSSRLSIRLSRGEHWIRVHPLDEIPLEKIRFLSKTLGLSIEIQEDGYVVVHGKESVVNEFIRNLGKSNSK